MRFSTKSEAETAAVGRYAGFIAVFVGDHYAPAYGLPRGGWYLFYGHGSREQIAGVK